LLTTRRCRHKLGLRLNHPCEPFGLQTLQALQLRVSKYAAKENIDQGLFARSLAYEQELSMILRLSPNKEQPHPQATTNFIDESRIRTIADSSPE
jgi:hypothetical protein